MTALLFPLYSDPFLLYFYRTTFAAVPIFMIFGCPGTVEAAKTQSPAFLARYQEKRLSLTLN